LNYFIANLAAHFAVVTVFVILACICANRNRKNKTKHVVTYFFPALFAAIAIFFGCRYAGPRLFDIDSVLNEKFFSHSGTVTEVSTFKNYFEIDGEHYYMNPLRNNIEEGDEVRIRFTPYAKYVVEVTDLGVETEEELKEAEQ